MRMSRRLALGQRIPQEIRLFWDGWVSGYTWTGYGSVVSNKLRLESIGQSMSGDHGGGSGGAWQSPGYARNADIYVDLTKYTKVHFVVSGSSADIGSAGGYLAAGSVQDNNIDDKEHVLDISGIADRSNLRIRIHLNAAAAPDYSDHAKTMTYNYERMNVSRVWVTRD